MVSSSEVSPTATPAAFDRAIFSRRSFKTLVMFTTGGTPFRQEAICAALIQSFIRCIRRDTDHKELPDSQQRELRHREIQANRGFLCELKWRTGMAHSHVQIGANGAECHAAG
jgi:hypothetical protein